MRTCGELTQCENYEADIQVWLEALVNSVGTDCCAYKVGTTPFAIDGLVDAISVINWSITDGVATVFTTPVAPTATPTGNGVVGGTGLQPIFDLSTLTQNPVTITVSAQDVCGNAYNASVVLTAPQCPSKDFTIVDVFGSPLNCPITFPVVLNISGTPASYASSGDIISAVQTANPSTTNLTYDALTCTFTATACSLTDLAGVNDLVALPPVARFTNAVAPVLNQTDGTVNLVHTVEDATGTPLTTGTMQVELLRYRTATSWDVTGTPTAWTYYNGANPVISSASKLITSMTIPVGGNFATGGTLVASVNAGGTSVVGSGYASLFGNYATGTAGTSLNFSKINWGQSTGSQSGQAGSGEGSVSPRGAVEVGADYVMRIRVQDSSGVWSDWDYSLIEEQYKVFAFDTFYATISCQGRLYTITTQNAFVNVLPATSRYRVNSGAWINTAGLSPQVILNPQNFDQIIDTEASYVIQSYTSEQVMTAQSSVLIRLITGGCGGISARPVSVVTVPVSTKAFISANTSFLAGNPASPEYKPVRDASVSIDGGLPLFTVSGAAGTNIVNQPYTIMLSRGSHNFTGANGATTTNTSFISVITNDVLMVSI